MTTLSFPVPPKRPPWSTNKAGQMHWATRRDHHAQWKKAIKTACERAGIGSRRPSTVTVSIPFPRRARRDPHNYVGTVCKAIVDGLVEAGVWPDDTAEWVTVNEPTLRVSDLAIVHVEIEDRG